MVLKAETRLIPLPNANCQIPAFLESDRCPLGFTVGMTLLDITERWCHSLGR